MNLETKRLLFRHWEDSDAEELYRWAKDPAVGPPAGWNPHTSVENSRDIIKEFLSDEETYALILKSTGLPVGSIGLKTGSATDLTDEPDEAEIGYWLAVPYWGHGLMSEAVKELTRHAFEDLAMKRLWCGYYEGNRKSWRVQEKCGFIYHHTTKDLEVPQTGDIRTGHVSTLSLEDWSKNHE